jgi:hypothetical protein
MSGITMQVGGQPASKSATTEKRSFVHVLQPSEECAKFQPAHGSKDPAPVVRCTPGFVGCGSLGGEDNQLQNGLSSCEASWFSCHYSWFSLRGEGFASMKVAPDSLVTVEIV